MRVVGIIAEFDPFHSGHRYLISRAKELTGDPRAKAAIVMSGPYVQRGNFSILPKHVRARQALKNGADLVIELPFTFACAPSERFARGAVSALMKTGIVTDIAFGIDTSDPSLIEELAYIDPDDSLIRSGLSEGMSYPAARAAAVVDAWHSSHPDASDTRLAEVRSAVRQPNSVLAADYLRAMKELRAGFKVYMIPRTSDIPASDIREKLYDTLYRGDLSSSGLQLPEQGRHCAASASSEMCGPAEASVSSDMCDPAEASPSPELRCSAGTSPSAVATELQGLMPDSSLALMLEGYGKGSFTIPDRDRYMRDMILSLKARSAEGIAYMTDGLEGYIRNTFEKTDDISYNNACSLLATKHFILPRSLRAMTSFMLGQTADYTENEKDVRYLRVLGFTREGRYCLKIMRKCSKLPVITNPSDALSLYSSDPPLHDQFELDLLANNLQAAYLGMPHNYEWDLPPVMVR